MTFDKSKVYTALNADESLIGAKGYFASDLLDLKELVEKDGVVTEVIGCYEEVSKITDVAINNFSFFYLVEPALEKYYVYKIISSDNYTNPVKYSINAKSTCI